METGWLTLGIPLRLVEIKRIILRAGARRDMLCRLKSFVHCGFDCCGQGTGPEHLASFCPIYWGLKYIWVLSRKKKDWFKDLERGEVCCAESSLFGHCGFWLWLRDQTDTEHSTSCLPFSLISTLRTGDQTQNIWPLSRDLIEVPERNLRHRTETS